MARRAGRSEKRPRPRVGGRGRGGGGSGDDRLSRQGHYHGPDGLNGRVRDGNGWGPASMVAGKRSGGRSGPPGRAFSVDPGVSGRVHRDTSRGCGRVWGHVATVRGHPRTRPRSGCVGAGPTHGRRGIELTIDHSSRVSGPHSHRPLRGGCGGGSGWSSRSAVRTGRLRRSPPVHSRPIDLVVFQEPSGSCPWKPGLGGGFALRCLQRLSGPDLATRRCPERDSRHTRGRSSPILSY